MKSLVIYYSYTGNNRLLAETLAARLSCDICPVIEARRRTGLTVLLDMLFRRTPPLQPLACLPAQYDHIILVAPIWNAKLANPMKTLVKREHAAFAEYSFLSLCGYERPKQKERITQELTALTGRAPRAVAELIIGALFPAEQRQKIQVISQYRVTSADLQTFAPQIEAFLQRLRDGLKLIPEINV